MYINGYDIFTYIDMLYVNILKDIYINIIDFLKDILIWIEIVLDLQVLDVETQIEHI